MDACFFMVGHFGHAFVCCCMETCTRFYEVNWLEFAKHFKQSNNVGGGFDMRMDCVVRWQLQRVTRQSVCITDDDGNNFIFNNVVHIITSAKTTITKNELVAMGGGYRIYYCDRDV